MKEYEGIEFIPYHYNWSASPFTQEYQKLEGKMKQDSTRDKSGINWRVIGEKSGSDQVANTVRYQQSLVVTSIITI